MHFGKLLFESDWQIQYTTHEDFITQQNLQHIASKQIRSVMTLSSKILDGIS